MPMRNAVRAISIDLDDTLWEVRPVILRAEQAVYDLLASSFPRVAQRYGLDAMREQRNRLSIESPHLGHDLTALRRLSLERMLTVCGYPAAEAEGLMECFLEWRHRVTLFPEVLSTLQALSQRYPLVALSNGNADVFRLRIGEYFHAAVNAQSVGVAKPHPQIYLRVCELLELQPDEVLHVGDHPVDDVQGGAQAGMLTAWLNREGRAWSGEPAPDYTVTSLAELLD